MALTSHWFHDNDRCQQCAVDHKAHILQGDRGLHVYLVQQSLIMLDAASIDAAELDSWTYGPSTARAVLDYKSDRHIINKSYQSKPDDIVGKMTIASLDEGMRGVETGMVFLGGAGLFLKGILLAAPTIKKTGPKLVVVTETAQPWSKWADQVVAKDPKGRAKVPIPNGQSPSTIAASYKKAAALAGTGGTIVISVGHGVPDANSSEDGMFDLGPANSFRVCGRNGLLVGDAIPKDQKGPPKFHHTSAYYDFAPPKPYRSRKADDEDSGSQNAKKRLANWKAYDEIAQAFRAQKLAAVVMLTCRIGSSSKLIQRVAGQWGSPIIGYPRRVVGQEMQSKRASVFLEGDAEGTNWTKTTNTPYSETFFPISRDTVQINP